MSCKEASIGNIKTATRPNVILIVTDDQGYGDLGYHGNPYLKTSHLDKFAAESLELSNFHVGTTCAPTRAGIMTGRNANRNNAWHTIAGCSILLETEETMAEVFARNGYETSMYGKWHLGDNYPFRPQDRGFGHTLYHGGGGIGQTPDYWGNDYFNDTYFRNGEPEVFKGYCTDVWFNEAIDFVKKQDGKVPFFMYLAPNAAHGPFNVPEKYAKLYANDSLTEMQKRFYGMISNIDDNFGRLVAALKESGQFSDTILIFTTDNGTALGISRSKVGKELGYNAGLRGIKGSNYDGGHKVPFFVSWPNGPILKKARLDELVAHVDLLPTLAELTGIPYTPKNPLDGASMAKVLEGGDRTAERMLVVDTQRNQWPQKGKSPCVMSTKWRLVNGTELYNTQEDPGQKNDLAQQRPRIVAQMKTFYDQWWANMERDVRYAEIPIGLPRANPVRLTIHDMHTQDGLPWNQVQIRKGGFAPDGFYSVRITEDGDYRFKLYRYAPESNLGSGTVAREVMGTSFREGLPAGKGMQFQRAMVQMENQLLEAPANMERPYVILEGKLKKGSYALKSNFMTPNGTVFPSYYTEIEKL
ncbi:MAG: arylsulfatase [Bacteroidota bacterium]